MIKAAGRSWNLASIGIFLLALASAACNMVSNTPSAEAARALVEVYLRVEYEADTLYNRAQLITFSPQRRVHLESKTEPGLGPYDFYINSGDPVFVVSAYEIVKIEVQDKRASVIVSYNRLARIVNGMGTISSTLLTDKKANDLVTLNLVFDKEKWWSLKGQWWVLDPPPPRVSKQALIKYYESLLKWYVERQKEIGKLPRHQQDAYDRKSGTLRILKNLP